MLLCAITICGIAYVCIYCIWYLLADIFLCFSLLHSSTHLFGHLSYAFRLRTSKYRVCVYGKVVAFFLFVCFAVVIFVFNKVFSLYIWVSVCMCYIQFTRVPIWCYWVKKEHVVWYSRESNCKVDENVSSPNILDA